MKKHTKLSLCLGSLLLSSCSFTFYSSSSVNNDSSSFSSSSSKDEISSSSSLEESSSESSSFISSSEESDSVEDSSSIEESSKEESSSIEESSSEESLSSEEISSEQSSSSSSSLINEDGYYRIEPIKSNSSSFNVYNLDGSIYKTIRKSIESDSSTWYIDPMEVALYYQAYNEAPINYCYNDRNETNSVSEEHFAKYGNYARFYSKDYTRSDGYMTSVPSPNEYRYFELDISNGSDGYSYWSRKTSRLVVIYKGLKQYSSTSPVILYTTNHYASFFEVTNFAKKNASSSSLSWIGDEFDGESSGYGEYIPLETFDLNY